MNYLQAYYCAAFAHSVPAYITYCYGIALNKQILYCRPKRTSDGAGRLTRCRLRFHFFPFSVRWSPLTSGFLPAILRRCKFYTLYRKTVNVLHQWFRRNIIFTATTLYLKHILSIYDTTISDPQPFRSADFMISIVHLSRPPLCWFRLFRFLLPSTFELSFTFHLFPLAYLLIFQYNNPKVERIWHYYIHRASLCQVGIVKVCCIFQNE